MSVGRVSSQSNVSYTQVQDVARLLPDAVAETFGDLPTNVMKAVNGITSAVTGVVRSAFFRVVEVDSELGCFARCPNVDMCLSVVFHA